MAEQHSAEGASTSGASVSSSDSALELNIKTLDSHIYKFQVDKNMSVLSFKGKIADQTSLPVGQQRLIFRGKVLKDEHLLSEYHVESGDTLHLVERQPIQPQTSSDTSGNNGSQGNDASSGVPRNRIGQISHNVVLGLNVGDQGDGAVFDLNRVIGAVFNSLGVGNPATTNAGVSAAVGAQNVVPTNSSGPVPQGSNAEGRGSTGGPTQAQTQFGQPFLSQPFPIPFMGASVPPTSLTMPIPDSLNTLSEFISRMEGVLSQNGYQPTSSATSTTEQPVTELPSNARGLPTPEALGIVLRHAQRLLSGLAVAALSHTAGQLEQGAGSTDASVRNQIQSDSVQVGLAMQHLGALFLELGRTILTLRMGQSPAEAVVNAGPAVYISPSGPNPIMVQPFPQQTIPLFNPPAVTASNSGMSIPVGIVGSAPRNISIHILTGTTSVTPVVSAVGTRAAGGEGAEGERGGSGGPVDSATARVLPVRNVIAAAVPHSATVAVSPVPNTSQSVGGVSTSQVTDAATLSSALSQVYSRIRGSLENMRTESQTPSGQQENPVVPDFSAGSGGVAETIDPIPSNSMQPECSRVAVPEGKTKGEPNFQTGSFKSNEESVGVGDVSASCVSRELSKNSESKLKDVQISGDAAKGEVPLGLGGGLQPKRRSNQSKTQLMSGEGGASGNSDQSQLARASGQQILQSLFAQSTAGRNSSNDPVVGQTGQAVAGAQSGTQGQGGEFDVTGMMSQLLGQTGQGLGQAVAGAQSGTQNPGGQVDITGMMSQLLQSPALNGLLSGVAQQTGVGSPDVMRNMLQQFTQNPAMRNTFNQLAQQVDREDVRDMFAGAGTGQGGGLDFSSMFQQMMPVVSQVLGGASVQNELVRSMGPELQSQVGARLSGDDSRLGRRSQNDIQEVVQQISVRSSSQDIFRSVVQNAVDRSGTAGGELVEGLSSNQELVDQFLEVLRRDLLCRLQGNNA